MARVPFLLLSMTWAACAPPTPKNDSPSARVISPVQDSRTNEGDGVIFTVEIKDPDGDEPLSVSIDDDIDGLLYDVDSLPSSTTVFQTFERLARGPHDATITVSDGISPSRVVTVSFVVNGRPSPPGLTITPNVPTPTDDVLAEVTTPSVDPEGAQVLYAWTWSKEGGQPLTGTGTTARLPAGRTSVGEVWTISFEAYEARNDRRITSGASSTTTLDVEISNETPTIPTSITLLPSRPLPSHDLRCAAEGSVDPDGLDVTYAFTWSKQVGPRYEDAPEYTTGVLPASATTAGEVWRCQAAGSDGFQEGPSLSAEVQVHALDASPEDADLVLAAPPGLALVPEVALVDDAAQPGPESIAMGAPGLGQVLVIDLPTLRALPAPGWPAYQTTLDGLLGGRLGATVVGLPDADGDALPDLVVTEPSANRVWAVSTAGGLLAPGTDLTSRGASLTPRNGTGFGVSAVGVDLTGNGRGEVLVLQQDPAAADSVWVFPDRALPFGGTTDSRSANTRIVSSFTDDRFVDLDVGGDYTGDGVPDLVIGRIHSGSGPGRTRIGAYVFSGQLLATSDSPIEDFNAWVQLGSVQDTGAGTQVGFFQDLDGDGKDEVWMSVPGYNNDRGRIGVFTSDIAGFLTLDFLNDDQLLSLVGELAGDRFGERAQVLGDLGGDGVPELAVAAPGAQDGRGRVYVFDGRQLREAVAANQPVLDAADAAWWTTGANPGDALTLAGPGMDLDADGALDLLLGSPIATGGNGRLYAWLSGR